ncbi:translation initiation factor IF-2 [Candidatus Aerophobetes bacterium]|nr:translation initiation factor IF-2 [Candidatus Aerophobetes bacterium]
MRVYELAKKLNLRSNQLLKTISKLGIKSKSNLSSLSLEEVKKIKELVYQKPSSKKREKICPRDPVITLLGHVDHGKTSLLDAIRKTRVAQQEIGGITQHIGASEIKFQGKRIVFIDTPGHEAFSAMRAQGAQVTDIVILVIAADDGIMPQTVEAINHARAAKVPILVAINKIDKKEANVERVKKQLTKYDLTPEEWGGETICVEVSALTRQGINELLEMVLLEAEMLELKADPEGELEAVVIEAEIDRKKGPLSTLLVKKGTLRRGDIIAGKTTYGKVRSLINWKGEMLKEAGPSTPVRVLGLSSIGTPGEIFKRVSSEKEARLSVEKFIEKGREKTPRRETNLEILLGKKEEKKERVLNVIIKTDTQGSLKALLDVLKNFEKKGQKINIIHGGVGEIKKSDIFLAAASKSLIIGFNAGISPENNDLAKKERVEIRRYRIIYEVVENIERILQGFVEPELEEVLVGKARVREIFKIPQVGIIAGAYVEEGRIVKGNRVKIIREEKIIGEGSIGSLKHFQKDVKEVISGLECGIKIKGFTEIKKEDIIEAYETKQK